MTIQVRYWIGTGFQALLLALGIWAVYIGKVGLGTGLIAATLAVFVIRSIKTKRVVLHIGFYHYYDRKE